MPKRPAANQPSSSAPRKKQGQSAKSPGHTPAPVSDVSADADTPQTTEFGLGSTTVPKWLRSAGHDAIPTMIQRIKNSDRNFAHDRFISFFKMWAYSVIDEAEKYKDELSWDENRTLREAGTLLANGAYEIISRVEDEVDYVLGLAEVGGLEANFEFYKLF